MNEASTSTDRASLTAVCSAYYRGVESQYPLFIKHPSGVVLLGFRTPELAATFLRVWHLPEPGEVAFLSQLGTPEFPNHPGWMHQTDQVMLISSEDDLRAFARDQEAFTRSAALWSIPFHYGPVAEPSNSQ